MADRRYRLSEAADADLERLYEWGIDHFWIDAADTYYDGLLARINNIGEAPQVWPAVDHIRIGYRRSVYLAHSIYSCVEASGVQIVRILDRENPATSLPER